MGGDCAGDGSSASNRPATPSSSASVTLGHASRTKTRSEPSRPAPTQASAGASSSKLCDRSSWVSVGAARLTRAAAKAESRLGRPRSVRVVRLINELSADWPRLDVSSGEQKLRSSLVSMGRPQTTTRRWPGPSPLHLASPSFRSGHLSSRTTEARHSSGKEHPLKSRLVRPRACVTIASSPGPSTVARQPVRARVRSRGAKSEAATRWSPASVKCWHRKSLRVCRPGKTPLARSGVAASSLRSEASSSRACSRSSLVRAPSSDPGSLHRGEATRFRQPGQRRGIIRESKSTLLLVSRQASKQHHLILLGPRVRPVIRGSEARSGVAGLPNEELASNELDWLGGGAGSALSG
mmetsp:Transcript_12953/g.30558  ORF Transcript_12953/g.30558 Transcript_12953/m.30558 type:complete len:352 (-) Transcript_12953:994-2049(-)